MLAMHMANELLTPAVAGVFGLISLAAIVFASWRAGKALDAERIPLMGVMGAFVFAAQMINLTLPGMPGTSGHLLGGVLTAIVLGPHSACLVMSSVVIVQCLIFQDGGLLALGTNIFNIAVVSCYLGYGLYRLILAGGAERINPARLMVAVFAASLLGVIAPAALVPVEAAIAGILQVRFRDFFAVMVGVHIISGLVEGLITFAVVGYLFRVRPMLLDARLTAPVRLTARGVAVSFLIAAIIFAGFGSWLASPWADALERALQGKTYGRSGSVLAERSSKVERVEDLQSRYALMPDYERRRAPLGQLPPGQPEDDRQEPSWPKVSVYTSLAGVGGALAALAVIYVIGSALGRRGTGAAAAHG